MSISHLGHLRKWAPSSFSWALPSCSHHTWQIHILSKWSMADSLGCLGSEMPKAKGEGISLMVSDFLTADWVCLCDDNRCTVAGLVLWSHSHSPTPGGSKAQIIFWPGKNREGWFTADHLLAQVNHMINIFNGLTNGDAQALFIFDNAPSHQKQANDAISAQQMVKGVHLFSFSFSHSHSSSGPINPEDHTCIAVGYLLANANHFTFLMITPSCPAGSRACSKFFSNVGCGQKQAYLYSAHISSAPLAAWAAAASVSFFFNLTLQINVHSSRSSLRGMAICAIFILSTTASSISLSNIREQQRPDTMCSPKQRQSMM